MSTFIIPADAQPSRPAFRDGQTLRAADLRAEAGDRIRAAHNHQAAAHSPGVVAGLWLTVTGNKLSIAPGAAVDAKGRMILVANDLDDTEPPELPDTRQFPIEVWLAYREDPEDADGPHPPDRPPDRYTEQFDVLLARPGEILSDDPRCPVFLGAISERNSDHSQRKYVGAVGGRVEAASRRVRLLLGPDGPDDLRIFAIGSRNTPRDPYTDHVTADAVGSLTLAAPILVGGRGKDDRATVVAGDRPPGFAATDIRDPAAVVRRWNQVAALMDVLAGHVNAALILPAAGAEAEAQLKANVARALNRVVNGVPVPPRKGTTTDVLVEAVRQAGVVPGGAVRQELSARAMKSPLMDEAFLRRLLLEDAFAGLVSPLTEADPGPVRGVSFAGVAAPPALARPGGVYLAEVTDKTGTRRELRIEFRDPGKEQHPERYKVCIGTAANLSPQPGEGTSGFTPALTVAADKTVTIAGTLDVFVAGGSSEGLILKVTPTADPNDPAVKAAQLGSVSPDDLLIHKDPHPQVAGDVVWLSTDAQLVNKGQAPMVGVQLHATLFPTNNTNQEPITVTLLRGLTLKAGQASALVSPVDGKTPLTVPLLSPEPDGPDFRGLPANTELTLILKALGAGPGNVVAQVARRMKFSNRTP